MSLMPVLMFYHPSSLLKQPLSVGLSSMIAPVVNLWCHLNLLYDTMIRQHKFLSCPLFMVRHALKLVFHRQIRQAFKA